MTSTNREFIRDILRETTAVITFVKKDGTERTMRCTLKEDQIKVYQRKTDRVKPVNEEILPVFDLDKNEWRSVTLATIKTVEAEEA